MTITRRALLSGAASAPFAAQAGLLLAGESEAIFADAVRQVGGVTGLAPTVVQAVQQAFVARFGKAALSAFAAALLGKSVDDVVAAGDAALGEQVRFIALALFTGEIETDGKTRAVLYPWSLAWATLGFSKAPGLCGGPAFGHWQHAP